MSNDPSSSLLQASEIFNLEDMINPIDEGDDVEIPGLVMEERVEETPEPLSGEEMERLMKKVEWMGVSGDGELARLVRRLVMTAPTSEQIRAQAETIAELSLQRDYLLERQSEDRLNWEMEKDEWERSSEILLARANVEGGRSRELQLEHRNNNTLSENTSLRNKLSFSADRIAYLESEISQLKPLLLMQPMRGGEGMKHSQGVPGSPSKVKKVPPTPSNEPGLSSSTIGAEKGDSNATPKAGESSTQTASASATGTTTTATAIGTTAATAGGASNDEMQVDLTSSTPQAEPKTPATNNIPLPPSTPTPKPRTDYYRGSFSISSTPNQSGPRTPGPITLAPPTSPSKSTITAPTVNTTEKANAASGEGGGASGPNTKVRVKAKPRPSSADAKTECIILAARKLGRERTTYLSGMYIPPASYYAYPGGYHPVMGMGMPFQYPQGYIANPNQSGSTTTAAGGGGQQQQQQQVYSPFFTHGNTAYAFAPYPSTPPPKGRGSFQGVFIPGSGKRANYYPNVVGDKKGGDGEKGKDGDGDKVGGMSKGSPNKAPTTPRTKRKATFATTPTSSCGIGSSKKTPSNALTTPSAMDSLLSAAQTVLSSPTPSGTSAGVGVGARRKRRRLLPPEDMDVDIDVDGDGDVVIAKNVGAGSGVDMDGSGEEEITPTLAESTFRARARKRASRVNARDGTPTPTGSAGANGKGKSKSSNGNGNNKSLSALDVLADQATIFHSQESGQSSEDTGLESEDGEERDVVQMLDGEEEEEVDSGRRRSLRRKNSAKVTKRARLKRKERASKAKSKGKGKARESAPPEEEDEIIDVDGSGEEDHPIDIDGDDGRDEDVEASSRGETDADADGEADADVDVDGENEDGDESKGEDGNDSTGEEESTQPIEGQESIFEPKPSTSKQAASSSSTKPSPEKIKTSGSTPSLAPPISLPPNASMPFIPMHTPPFPFPSAHPPPNGMMPTTHYTVFYGNKPFQIPFTASFFPPPGSQSSSSNLANHSTINPNPTHPWVARLTSSQTLPPSFAGLAIGTPYPMGKGFIHHEPTTGKRMRSPYTKWTPEEDVLLEKAVEKHGQKWDLVQKEFPNRGYHQVRQRWLRKQHAKEGSKTLNESS